MAEPKTPVAKEDEQSDDDEPLHGMSRKLRDFLAAKIESGGKAKRRAAIFTHKVPDPDAIGAQVGMRYLLSTYYGMECDCFVDGEISHPQNKATVQLLDPHLIPVDDYKEGKYLLKVLVDAIPSNAGIGRNEVKFDVVVDHHKDLPATNFDGLCLHKHSGSACGLVYDLMQGHGIHNLDVENEEHQKIATAIMVGVITDTNHCTSVDTTKLDFEAQQAMFLCCDHTALRKIVFFKRSMNWIKLLGTAIHEVQIHDGVAVVGLGVLDGEQKDVIADVASSMMTWYGVSVAVVFALFDGERIQGSVRTLDDTVEVHAKCMMLGGPAGIGGGKSCSGGYTKPLGSFYLKADENDELKDRFWDITKQREIDEIFKVMNK